MQLYIKRPNLIQLTYLKKSDLYLSKKRYIIG